jgi:arsenate reductase
MKKRVLFICTANSCRSQMAEAVINHFLGNKIEAFSAGTQATAVHPLTIKAMLEIGIDISQQLSKNLSAFDGQNFDYVITLCGSANETCPLYIGGSRKMHIGFDDPTEARGTEEDILREFRRVRDEIKERLLIFFKSQNTGN